MTDFAPSGTPSSTTLSPADKKRAAADERRQQRLKNDRLFLAVQDTLRSPTFQHETSPTSDQRLDAIRAAIAAGANVNARATSVTFAKARPLDMVAAALHLPQTIGVMRVLLDQGADLQARDREGNTFTHLLAGHLWSSRVNDTFLTNLRQWMDLGGADHMGRKNRDGDTPMSIGLQKGLYSLSVDQYRSVLGTMTAAGASVTDLPGDLLSNLLIRNHREAFDLAVDLGVSVHHRYKPRHFQTENLWGVWAYHYFGHNGRNHNADSRRAWMERLIELGVDVHTAHDPNLDHVTRDEAVTPHSALMVVLYHASRDARLDEVCLTRLKDLGCCQQTAGHSPLHDYAEEGKVDHLAVLHHLGFDLAGARNALDETLLHVACSADLRGKTVYEGQTCTIQGTVQVLLEAGCDPNAIAGPASKLGRALSEAVTNTRTFSDRFDRTATVQRLIDAGAALEGDVPSSTLVGRLMYPHAFSTEKNGQTKWQGLSVDDDRRDTVMVLLRHGARVPERLVQDGMPLLLGLRTFAVAPPPPINGSSPPPSARQALWDHLVANESPEWPTRLAHQAIDWLAQGNWTTGIPKAEEIPVIDWLIARGVSASALGEAFRASSFKPDDPLAHTIETHELRAELRAVIPEDHVLPSVRRPRL